MQTFQKRVNKHHVNTDEKGNTYYEYTYYVFMILYKYLQYVQLEKQNM